MHSITNEDVSLLLSEAQNSKSKTARLILHSPNSNSMQCMLIAFAPNVVYPPISDNLDGNIVFTCIRGELFVNLFKESSREICETYNLKPGELISIPRRRFRSTVACAHGAVFLESIEGAFVPEVRKYLYDHAPDVLV